MCLGLADHSGDRCCLANECTVFGLVTFTMSVVAPATGTV